MNYEESTIEHMLSRMDMDSVMEQGQQATADYLLSKWVYTLQCS